MGENCYFVVDESTNKAIVIDPGENGKKLNKKIDDNNLEVVAICLTHCHFDHIGAVAEVKAHTNALCLFAQEMKRLLKILFITCLPVLQNLLQ